MKELVYEDKKMTGNHLYFICHFIETMARTIHQRNRYVVNQLGKNTLLYLMCLNDLMLPHELPVVIQQSIAKYHLEVGDFDITDVNPELVPRIPNVNQMAKVYKRLILSTIQPEEDFLDALIRVYNDEICDKIDDYNCSAYYEPSYVITKAYIDKEF